MMRVLMTFAVLAACSGDDPTLTIENVGEYGLITMIGHGPCGTDPLSLDIQAEFEVVEVDLGPGDAHTLPVASGCNDVLALDDDHHEYLAKVVVEPGEDVTWELNP